MLKKVNTNLADKKIFIVNKKENIMQDLTSEKSKLNKQKWKLIDEYQKETRKIYDEKYREKIEDLNRKINRLQREEKRSRQA